MSTDQYPSLRYAGAAISTTGDAHRLNLLHQSVYHWLVVLGSRPLVVTVDGDQHAAQEAANVAHAAYEQARAVGSADTGNVGDVVLRPRVYRVGQPREDKVGSRARTRLRGGRLGVAANKNTGLELLMADKSVDHLFLSDDDTWPREPKALALHSEHPRLQHLSLIHI